MDWIKSILKPEDQATSAITTEEVMFCINEKYNLFIICMLDIKYLAMSNRLNEKVYEQCFLNYIKYQYFILNTAIAEQAYS